MTTGDKFRRGTQLAVSAAELYLTLEFLCYMLRNEHLHELAAEYLDTLRAKLEYRMEVARTLRFIRRLPE